VCIAPARARLPLGPDRRRHGCEPNSHRRGRSNSEADHNTARADSHDSARPHGHEPTGGETYRAGGNLGETYRAVNIIGFDLDADAGDQLRQAAEAGGGKFYAARNSAELDQVFKSKFDWVAWTTYYNCLYAAANQQFDNAYFGQDAVYTCVRDLINRESNDISSAVNERNRKFTVAVNAAFQANNTLRTLEQAGTFMDRVHQNDQYAMDHEHARWEAVMNAQQADWETTVSKAQAELENAQRELDQHWGEPRP
jgi:hypothetical protein